MDATCSICGAVSGDDTGYCSRFGTDPERRDSESAAIVDSLGFCAAHAASLAAFENRHDAVAEILSTAISRLVELLGRRELERDLLRPLLFGALDECPACAFAQHSLTTIVKQTATSAALRRSQDRSGSQSVALCVPHFRALVGACDPATLKAVVPEEIEFLSRAFDPILAETPGAAAGRPSAAASDGRFRLLAGHGTLTDYYVQGRRDQLGGVEIFDDVRLFLDHPAVCPVCALVSSALDRWLASVERAARIGLDVWTVFPTCADHLWLCARLGDRSVQRAVARHAARVFVDSLRTGLAKIEQHERNLEAASKSVWFRRKSPSYILGQWRKAVTKLPGCPGCERAVVARDRAIGQLLDALTRDWHRRALERGHGLCLKHFAHAYLVATGPGIREALTAVHIEKLSAINLELRRYLAESSAKAGAPTHGPLADVCRRAIYRLSAAA